MTTFPGSPKSLRGGLVLADPGTGKITKVIALQYNPTSLSRTLQIQTPGEGGDRADALRLTGAPVETIKLEAEIDAADQLEFPEQHALAAELGIYPQLAALEALIYPASGEVQANHNLAATGALEIIPVEAPLTLFVWSKSRVLPVRLTDFSVTEEAFDRNLNPLRAKVSLGMRVLSTGDLGFDHTGGNLFHNYHRQLERYAAKAPEADKTELGISGGLDV